MLKQPKKRPVGVGQLSLVEHALCPLASTGVENLVHSATYFYSDAMRKRKAAQVRVFAPLGLLPNDELYLWGLLNLTMSLPDHQNTFTATPHWCLKQMGLIDHQNRRGGRQYHQFYRALERLSSVKYLSDACYDPSRGEYRKVSFGFFSYSLPTNIESSRAWTVSWDNVFMELIQAKGGGMRFDLELYRLLDVASRRLFLFVLKVGYRKGRLPVMELRHVAVDLLGISPSVSLRDMKAKVLRILKRLEEQRVIANPTIVRREKGAFQVTFERGSYLDQPQSHSSSLSIDDFPILDGLIDLGFDKAAAISLLKKHSPNLVVQWLDVTQAALEKFGRSHFRVSPMAFLVDSLKQASLGVRTPPDWWQETKRKERKQQEPTEDGRRVFARLIEEVFGSEKAPTSTLSSMESAANILKKLG